MVKEITKLPEYEDIDPLTIRFFNLSMHVNFGSWQAFDEFPLGVVKDIEAIVEYAEENDGATGAFHRQLLTFTTQILKELK